MQFVFSQVEPGPCGNPSIASQVAGGRSKQSPFAKQHASFPAQAGAALHASAPMANTMTNRDFICYPLPKMSLPYQEALDPERIDAHIVVPDNRPTMPPESSIRPSVSANMNDPKVPPGDDQD